MIKHEKTIIGVIPWVHDPWATSILPWTPSNTQLRLGCPWLFWLEEHCFAGLVPILCNVGKKKNRWHKPFPNGWILIDLPTLDVLIQNVKPFFGGLIPMFDGWTAARL